MTRLNRFDISPRDGDFLLQLEEEGGKVVSLTLTPEQLDALIEAADDLLAEDDSVFEVDEDDDDAEDEGVVYQKPLG
jgi:hypothetical protein